MRPPLRTRTPSVIGTVGLSRQRAGGPERGTSVRREWIGSIFKWYYNLSETPWGSIRSPFENRHANNKSGAWTGVHAPSYLVGLNGLKRVVTEPTFIRALAVPGTATASFQIFLAEAFASVCAN